jgi:hypothetical protein
MGLFQKYLDKQEQLNEEDKSYKNIYDCFRTTLPDGETGVGIDIDGEVYKLTTDQALGFIHNIKVIIDQIKG